MKYGIWGYGQSGIKAMGQLQEILSSDEAVCYVDTDYRKVDLDAKVPIVSVHRLKLLLADGAIDRIIVPGYKRTAYSDIINELKDNDINPSVLYFAHMGDFIGLCKNVGTLEKVMQEEKKKIPCIASLEYEVSHYCNLNCQRCDHFSNLAKKGDFADVTSFSNDLKQISKFVENISEFKLLGGEPLLNPELDKFIVAAKEVFPRAQIYIFTNALILQQISKELMQCIKDNDVVVTFTVYPPMFNKIDDVVMFLRRNDIRFEVYHEVNAFAAWINLKGDSNPYNAEKACFSSECHCFNNGKIFKCTQALNIDVFNKQYNQELPEVYLDLYDEELTTEKLRNFLESPNQLCRYCGEYKWYSWEQTGAVCDLKEWVTDKKL